MRCYCRAYTIIIIHTFRPFVTLFKRPQEPYNQVNLLRFVQLIKPPVSQPQHQVGKHHRKVRRIQVYHKIKRIIYLVEHPRNISRQDDDQKKHALSLGRPCLVRPVDGCRPCRAKAAQHHNLKNCSYPFALQSVFPCLFLPLFPSGRGVCRTVSCPAPGQSLSSPFRVS